MGHCTTGGENNDASSTGPSIGQGTSGYGAFNEGPHYPADVHLFHSPLSLLFVSFMFLSILALNHFY